MPPSILPQSSNSRLLYRICQPPSRTPPPSTLQTKLSATPYAFLLHPRRFSHAVSRVLHRQALRQIRSSSAIFIHPRRFSHVLRRPPPYFISVNCQQPLPSYKRIRIDIEKEQKDGNLRDI